MGLLGLVALSAGAPTATLRSWATGNLSLEGTKTAALTGAGGTSPVQGPLGSLSTAETVGVLVALTGLGLGVGTLIGRGWLRGPPTKTDIQKLIPACCNGSHYKTGELYPACCTGRHIPK